MQDWSYKPARDLGLPPDQRLKSVSREPGLFGLFTHWTVSTGIGLYLKTYHRMKVIGRQHLPKKLPFILVANHCSHLDALILAPSLPAHLRWSTFPVAAGDVFFESVGMSAFAAYCMNALPIWRKNCGPHALEQLRDRLINGPAGYILFPEGMRSKDGTMLPFKPGIGMLIAGTEAAVIPAHIEGASEALQKGTKFPRPHKIVLRVGPAFDFSSVKNNREGWQEIARKLEEAVKLLASEAESRPALAG
jgi:1-acyl-sn-glycerol-3-phosphate acyltransferase